MRSRMLSGFTLIEILIVIGIIGLLATLVLVAINRVKERGKTAETSVAVREVQNAAILYYTDTGKLPSDCRLNCTATADPFLTRQEGVSRWSGPYHQIYDLTHAWGGHIGIASTFDFDGDGTEDYAIVLDDDKPGGTGNDQGRIPEGALTTIDAAIDDGNLSTGRMRGNGQGYFSAIGEAVIILDEYVAN